MANDGGSLGLKANLKVRIDNKGIPDTIGNLSGLKALTDEVLNWYNGLNKVLLMQSVGQILDYIIQENFEQQGRPKQWDGWKTYKNPNRNWENRRAKPPYNKGDGKILQLFGNLRNSIQVTEVTSDSVLLSTNLAYANRMNFGGGGIPARPFMIIPESEYDLIAEAIFDYFKIYG